MSKKKKNKPFVPQPADPPAPAQAPESDPGRNRWILVAAIAALLSGGLLVWQLFFSAAVKRGAYSDYNVLFITLDTTRADHLPAYGYTKGRTPNLDALAKESFVFEDAISPVPLTLPSHCSMMTGRLPIAHGVRDNAGFFLNQSEVTIAERFKEAGYATSAFISAFVLDSRWQMNQGFDVYHDNFNLAQFQGANPRDIQRAAEETEIEASHWLESNRDRKFFSWIHFYDPHDPYEPPEPYATQFAGNLYDGEIAYTDDVLGRLFAKLQQLGLKEKTIIVITGDHGESLGEHNEETHAMFLYNTTQHVPLFVHVPKTAGGRVPGVVRLIDIAPTLLDLTGLQVLPDAQGSSMLSMMNGKEERKERLAYSESIYAEVHYGWSPMESITSAQYKYIRAPKPELYDRKSDPRELKNIISEKPSIAKVLNNEILDMNTKYASKNPTGPQKMDADTEEKLRALGYIGATAVSTEETRKIDPKDKIHLARGIQKAFDAIQSGDHQRSLDEIQSVLREDPNMVDAHFVAGVAAIGLKKYDLAVDELLRTLSFRPDHTMALYNLGYTYELQGNLTEAEVWYKKVLLYEPKHLFTSLKLAHIYRRWNQPEKARDYFMTALTSYERALEATKGDKAKAALHTTLGEIYFGAGDSSRAETNLRAAIQLNPQAASVNFNLAQILESKGDIAGAVQAYRQEIKNSPDNFKSYNNLGLIYLNMNRLDDAGACFQRQVELNPHDPRGYTLLIGVLEKLGRKDDIAYLRDVARSQGVVL